MGAVGAAVLATGVAGFEGDCSVCLESSFFLIGATMPYLAMEETRGSGVKIFTLAGLDAGGSTGGLVVSDCAVPVDNAFQFGLNVFAGVM